MWCIHKVLQRCRVVQEYGCVHIQASPSLPPFPVPPCLLRLTAGAQSWLWLYLLVGDGLFLPSIAAGREQQLIEHFNLVC